eukprot:CAMPEP_0195259778 /NCGR_PEP_ID=MMETSP0706-20130129/8173_1 /TAXON_ID=33640 /ORGANISM="Asterionellopsis glacialis, Strain CCMP134" /LENGTH=231 /DNA_ID=CAMNT_0040313355 /DNA_START=380 /DNA_END=1076 /DNA_ORIENTATION=-
MSSFRDGGMAIVWNDPELRALIDYDYIPWGNSYFPTEDCGGIDDATYDVDVRQCWYQKCITHDDDKLVEEDCFSGEPIYQHSKKEGQIDVYETCVKDIMGIDAAVSFTYCCEGNNMDDENLPSARDLMEKCIATGDGIRSGIADPVDAVQECLDVRGRSIEIHNAKQTPAHPGVPYVVVDGKPLDDPFSVKDAICERLEAKQGSDMKKPKSCRRPKEVTLSSSFLRTAEKR